MHKRGFTLVELLLVIAIIGILSSIVISSLAKAREKGHDAKVKSQMVSLKQAAEIYYDTNGAYGIGPSSSCSAGMFADVESGLSTFTSCDNYRGGCSETHLKCNSNGTEFAVSVNLSDGSYFCVDSTGYAGELASDPGAVVVCPITE